MLSFSSSRRIFLARSVTDMRREIDTLASMALGELASDPRRGDCFVFVGRDHRRSPGKPLVTRTRRRLIMDKSYSLEPG